MSTDREYVKSPNGEFAIRLGERLRALRGDRSQATFSDLLGVVPNTLRRYETGERLPDAEFLFRLNEIFSADIADLLGAAKKSARLAGAAEPLAKSPNAPWDIADYVFIPFYDIAISGGYGAEVLNERPKTWNAYRRDYIAKRGLQSDRLAEFSVCGDSMAPELNPGDTVMVDMRVTQIGAEDVYVQRIENTLVVKYIRRRPEGGFILRSANPSWPDQVILPTDYRPEELEVIGRVVRQGRDR